MLSTEKFAAHTTKKFVKLGGMNSYAERLQYTIDRANTSQAEVARKVGVKQQSIQYLCSPRATGSKHTTKIANILGVRPEWLATGEGPMQEEADIQLRYEKAPLAIQCAIQKLLRYEQHTEDAARAAKVVDTLIPNDHPQDS